MTLNKKILGLIGTCAIGALALTSPACGGDSGNDGGTNDGGIGFTFVTGVYQPTGAVTVSSDECMNDPNRSTDPTSGKTYKINVSASGTVDFYGNPEGTPRGTPAQPSNGTGQLTGSTATLVRDNDIPASAASTCAFHLKVTQLLTVVGDNQISATYTSTETNHTASCAPVATDCTTKWTWSLDKIQ